MNKHRIHEYVNTQFKIHKQLPEQINKYAKFLKNEKGRGPRSNSKLT